MTQDVLEAENRRDGFRQLYLAAPMERAGNAISMRWLIHSIITSHEEDMITMTPKLQLLKSLLASHHLASPKLEFHLYKDLAVHQLVISTLRV